MWLRVSPVREEARPCCCTFLFFLNVFGENLDPLNSLELGSDMICVVLTGQKSEHIYKEGVGGENLPSVQDSTNKKITCRTEPLEAASECVWAPYNSFRLPSSHTPPLHLLQRALGRCKEEYSSSGALQSSAAQMGGSGGSHIAPVSRHLGGAVDVSVFSVPSEKRP